MPSFSSVLALLFALSSGWSDLVIEQRIEGGGKDATDTTLRLKGSKVRVDFSGRTGPVSSIVDLDSGESVTLMPDQKTLTRRDGAQTRRTMEALRQRTGRMAATEGVKPETTGQKEKVGEFNTEIFTWNRGDGVLRVWVTKDVPNYAKVKEEFDRMATWTAGQAEAALFAIPGVIVKTEFAKADRKFTSTVVSLREEELDAAIFELPPDYRETGQREEADPDSISPKAPVLPDQRE